MRALTAGEKQRLFEGHALFGILDPGDVDALLARARFEHYPAGQLIFARGSPGRSMMAVLRGSIRISTTSINGRDEIALFDGGERTADAIAINDCDLLVVDQRDFIPFLKSRGDLCIAFLRLLSQRLRHTDELVEAAMFEPLESRLAKTLVRLASEAGSGNGAEPPLQLRVSQQELAGMIGASREKVNKQLRVWQRAGLLELAKRRVVIRDIGALQEPISA